MAVSAEERLERDRAKQRRYRERNRDKLREARRRYRAANREKILARERAYEDRRRDRRREEFKAIYAADPEKYRQKTRDWRAANPGKVKAFGRKHGERVRHGADIAVERAAMWEKQQGNCYLCGNDLDPDAINIDHDHDCCPRNRSCSYCRRGLACSRCNVLIGHAEDDPDLLELIASRLRPVRAATKARIAEKPKQMELLLDDEVS